MQETNRGTYTSTRIYCKVKSIKYNGTKGFKVKPGVYQQLSPIL